MQQQQLQQQGMTRNERVAGCERGTEHGRTESMRPLHDATYKDAARTIVRACAALYYESGAYWSSIASTGSGLT